MMKFEDVEKLAEHLLKAYGAMADVEALKQADKLYAAGDLASSRNWLNVTDRVREMQNVRHVNRTA